jgi:seryl-tRNA synthetase
MLDIRLLRDDPDAIRANLEARRSGVFEDLPPVQEGWAAATVARLVALDTAYRARLRDEEELRAKQHTNAEAMKAVARLPKEAQASERARLVEEGRGLRDRERELAAATEVAAQSRDEAWQRVPNRTHPQAPRGHSDDAHRTLREVGRRRDFAAEGFAARDHVAIAESLDLADFAAGAKVAGQKFYYLKNEAVMLDLALQHFALGVAARHGFTLHVTPDLARAEILAGLGFNPRGASTQVYSVADTDLCLVGTAEITLGGMLADELLAEERLPLLLAGLSHCFRTEAGAGGQESRGLYRVHQFTKVELFAFTLGDDAVSDAMHAKILAVEEEIFTALGVPYRVLDMATGDLATPAYRKFDHEAWMPGRGAWGEVTSTSNCTDYQARRLRIRYKEAPATGRKAGNRFVHMLNGTAVATGRALVAILENYQQADGSVVVPEVLRALVGRERIGPRAPAAS